MNDVNAESAGSSPDSAHSNYSLQLSPSVQNAAANSGLRRQGHSETASTTTPGAPKRADISSDSGSEDGGKESQANSSEGEDEKVDDEPQDAEIVLEPGVKVRIVGLVAAAQHNGKVGVIRSFDANRGRYIVELVIVSGATGSVPQKLAVREINIVAIQNFVKKAKSGQSRTRSGLRGGRSRRRTPSSRTPSGSSRNKVKGSRPGSPSFASPTSASAARASLFSSNSPKPTKHRVVRRNVDEAKYERVRHRRSHRHSGETKRDDRSKKEKKNRVVRRARESKTFGTV